MKVPIYKADGAKAGEQELNEAVFGVSASAALIQQVITSMMANARQTLAHTKIRSEVRGGGRKPWRQKGTGRARHGSIRSPLWRGGGVTFGPRKDRNFTTTIPKKMRRKALLSALSDKATDGKFIVLKELKLTGKTKDWEQAAGKALAKVSESSRTPSVLVALPELTDEVKRTTSNVQRVEAIRVDSLNVRVIVGHEYVVTTPEGVTALETWLTK